VEASNQKKETWGVRKDRTAHIQGLKQKRRCQEKKYKKVVIGVRGKGGSQGHTPRGCLKPQMTGKVMPIAHSKGKGTKKVKETAREKNKGKAWDKRPHLKDGIRMKSGQINNGG